MEHFISLEPVESDSFAESEIIRTLPAVRPEFATRGSEARRAFNKLLPFSLRGIINFSRFKPASSDLVKRDNIPFYYLPIYFPGLFTRSYKRKRYCCTIEQYLISENEKTGTNPWNNFMPVYVAALAILMKYLAAMNRFAITRMPVNLGKFVSHAGVIQSLWNQKMLKQSVI